MRGRQRESDRPVARRDVLRAAVIALAGLAWPVRAGAAASPGAGPGRAAPGAGGGAWRARGAPTSTPGARWSSTAGS